MSKYTVCFFVFLNIGALNAQLNSTSILDTTSLSIGAETRGNYFGGSVSALIGGLYGLFINSSESGGRPGLPLITAGFSYVPGSLVGLGIGAGLGEIF